MWFDREGEPITAGMWEMYRGVPDYLRVAEDWIGPIWISTVWLGLDHGFSRYPDRVPIIFETMIFGGPQDTACWRYASEVEAQAGHVAVAEMVRNHRHGWIKQARDQRRHAMKQRLRKLSE